MKIFLICIASWMSTAGLTVAQDTTTITIGHKHNIKSEYLGEDRSIFIYLPESYPNESRKDKKYPVLYVLDAETHFHAASGVISHMTGGYNRNRQIPEMIVVGIPNLSFNSRQRDLTPTRLNSFPKSGGGIAFLDFIQKEVIPFIDHTYRTDPYRILVGHSLGGLMALYSLIQVPDVFQGCIAIDPSVWWDNEFLIRTSYDTRIKSIRKPTTIYMGFANTNQTGVVAPQGASFIKMLEEIKMKNLRVNYEFFKNENHVSVPLLALYNGLLTIYSGYQPQTAMGYFTSTTVQNYYDSLSSVVGLTLLPPEGLVQQLANFSLNQKSDVDEAIRLHQINARNYPLSPVAFKNLGDLYYKREEYISALKCYQRCVELNLVDAQITARINELGK